MDKQELRSRLFDAVLEAALQEDFRRDLDALPDGGSEGWEPSAELDRRIERLIRAARRREAWKKLRKNARRTALAATLLVVVSFGSLMGVEASRNAIFNSIVSLRSDHAEIQFREKESSGAQESENGKVYRPAYLPAGFTESESMQSGPAFRTEYRNSQGTSIYFFQSPLTESGYSTVDTEHTTHREIEIDGQKAELFEAASAEDKNSLLWQNARASFMLVSTISSDELIHIAESIQ